MMSCSIFQICTVILLTLTILSFVYGTEAVIHDTNIPDVNNEWNKRAGQKLPIVVNTWNITKATHRGDYDLNSSLS
jgi:ABC-type dipeptide/oligopeptide/nickel transport system permease component